MAAASFLESFRKRIDALKSNFVEDAEEHASSEPQEDVASEVQDEVDSRKRPAETEPTPAPTSKRPRHDQHPAEEDRGVVVDQEEVENEDSNQTPQNSEAESEELSQEVQKPAVPSQIVPSKNNIKIYSRGEITPFRETEKDLTKAAWHNDRAIVQRLLKSGANPNSRNPAQIDIIGKNATALHIAAYRGFHKVCARLLIHNADASLLTSRGFTASDLARQQGHLDIVALIERVTKPGSGGHIGGGMSKHTSEDADNIPIYWTDKQKRKFLSDSKRQTKRIKPN